MSGHQCLKRLFLQVKQPELAEEPSAATQALFDQGHEVGIMAQRAFPGGVLVAEDHLHHEDAVRRTVELMRDKSVPAIFEAAFVFEGIRIRVDVLQREPRGLWRLIEVKQSTSVKDYHHLDLAVQEYVLKGCGLRLAGVELMHINNAYVYTGGEVDPLGLFTRVEMSADISDARQILPVLLDAERAALSRNTPPDVPIGSHCDDPFACEFKSHCWPEFPIHHISFLPRLGRHKRAALEALGIEDIYNLPGTFSANAVQDRAIRSIRCGRPIFEDSLNAELEPLSPPLVFMDFETCMPAVPRYPGMRPYQHVPFQWSVHSIARSGGRVRHAEFLSNDATDPRGLFIHSLLDEVERTPGPVVVYSRAFEESRLKELAEAHPHLAERIRRLCARLFDLLPVMRNHVYHPDFRGSFSLKAVVPALLPRLVYDDLDVSEGSEAGPAFLAMIHESTPDDERQRLRKALLEYCERDTLVMVELWRLLRRQVSGEGAYR